MEEVYERLLGRIVEYHKLPRVVAEDLLEHMTSCPHDDCEITAMIRPHLDVVTREVVGVGFDDINKATTNAQDTLQRQLDQLNLDGGITLPRLLELVEGAMGAIDADIQYKRDQNRETE